MTDRLLDDEAELLSRLARMARRADPVPPDVIAAAMGSFTFRTIDAELAELVYDSAMEQVGLAGVRGGGARQLTFEGPGLAVEVEVLGSGGRIVGQLVPPQPALVEVRHGGGSVTVRADELGRFHADVAVGSPMSLVCRADSSAGVRPPTETVWVVV